MIPRPASSSGGCTRTTSRRVRKVNRGVAYRDGKLFRGTQDGRVIAYDADDGNKLWETQIADPEKGESVPAAPIAWSKLVFAGNAGGDNFSYETDGEQRIAVAAGMTSSFWPTQKTTAKILVFGLP